MITGVFKFAGDGIGDGFCKAHIIKEICGKFQPLIKSLIVDMLILKEIKEIIINQLGVYHQSNCKSRAY
jgi:hypothetical protein